MKKFVVLAVFVFSLSFPVHSDQSSTNQFCSTINCDCSALSSEYWNEICLQQEQLIKEGCLNNQSNGFCGIHGEKAQPLALDIANFESNHDTIYLSASIYRDKFEAIFLDINTEASLVLKDVKYANYYKAKQRLTNLDENLDNVFSISLMMNELVVIDKKLKPRELWQDFGEASLMAAEELYGVSNSLMSFILDGKKTFNITDITYSSKRLAGYAYEQAAFAFGKSGNDRKAAKLWRLAAQTSKDLIAMNDKLFATSEEKRYVMAQAAARLHRASYHWLQTKDGEKAKDSYDESIGLYAKLNKDIEVLVAE